MVHGAGGEESRAGGVEVRHGPVHDRVAVEWVELVVGGMETQLGSAGEVQPGEFAGLLDSRR